MTQFQKLIALGAHQLPHPTPHTHAPGLTNLLLAAMSPMKNKKAQAVRSSPDDENDKLWRFVAKGGFPDSLFTVIVAHVGDDVFDRIVDGLPLLDFLWTVAKEESIPPYASPFQIVMDFKIDPNSFLKRAEKILAEEDMLASMIDDDVPVPFIRTIVETYPYIFDFKRFLGRLKHIDIPFEPTAGSLSAPNKKEILELLNTCDSWHNMKSNKEYIRAEAHHAAISKRKLKSRYKESGLSSLSRLQAARLIRASTKVNDDLVKSKLELYASEKKKGRAVKQCNMRAFDAAVLAAKIEDLRKESGISDAEKSKFGKWVLEGNVVDLQDEIEATCSNMLV